MKIIQDRQGFTLIEALVAMFILTVGILALYSMHTVSIKGNATANVITTASTWAADRVEQILAMDYASVIDTDLDGTAEDSNYDGIDDDGGNFGLDDQTVATADGNFVSPDARYTIYWNVADLLTPIPGSTDSYIKAIRVIVVMSDFGIQKQVVLNYYKQKIF